MECFDELLKSRDWCRSSLFQRSLANTEAEKAEVWKRYTAGEFRTAIDQVAASLDTVLSSIAPEERPDLERDLLQLCRRVRKGCAQWRGAFLGRRRRQNNIRNSDGAHQTPICAISAEGAGEDTGRSKGADGKPRLAARRRRQCRNILAARQVAASLHPGDRRDPRRQNLPLRRPSHQSCSAITRASS
jgi:hypothetical protein